jgi:serine/threonine-protein kinase
MPNSPTSPFDRRQPFLAQRLRERYEFLSALGRGGAGVVYEVRNLRLGRTEALKVLGEILEGEAAERFRLEAQVAASLSHPRIVKIHDFGAEDGIYWYAMDLVDGPTLAGLLAERGPLDAIALARAAIPILDALEHSHGRGIAHRDLKPANILLNREGRPHLTDFGLAKSRDSLLKTRTGLLVGTPAYVAPEQALLAASDHRVDIYAMGAMMYHLLSGRMPFEGDTALQVVVARLDKDPPPLQAVRPGTAPDLAAIIERAMRRDPEARHPSAGAMRDDLRRFCQAAGLPWEGPVPGQPFPPCLRTPLPAAPGQAAPGQAAPGQAAPGQAAPEAAPEPGPAPPDAAAANPGAAVPALRSWAWAMAVGGALLSGALLAGWRGRVPPVRLDPAAAAAPVPAAPPPAIPAPRAAKAATARPASVPAPGAVPAAAAAAPPPAAATPAPSAQALRPVPVTYPQLEQASPPETGQGCPGARVILSVSVGTDGTVLACRVLSAGAPACAQAARDAAMRYRFKPAQDAQGRPVPAATTIAIEFPEGP